ncbi:uncharacterized protein LOC143460739 [Clavelina lepadiformis]|uniref:uncharacterized protein LOC143460739 n=1 Tax=Clavelina lepadiformis TaxID=159417 RepID=UPI0040430FB9
MELSNDESGNRQDSVKYYANSPFDAVAVDKATQVTAATMLAVFGVIFLTGVLGHFCVVFFISRSRTRTTSSCFSAYVIIGNLTASHLLYLTTCLPAIAYTSLMELVTREWIFGDVTCRLVPFLERFMLGVTSLSFCALAIDRFRSAGHVNKGYEIARDSFCRGVCKMLVLWIGAFLLATPELLMVETRSVSVPVIENNQGDGKSLFAQLGLQGDQTITPDRYWTFRATFQNNMEPEVSELSRSKRLSDFFSGPSEPGHLVGPLSVESFSSNGTLYVRYKECGFGTSSWDKSFPPVVLAFIKSYSAFKHWWFLAFYFCLPAFFSLFFAFLVALRLTAAVRDVTNTSINCTGSYYVTNNGIDGGTLTSQREMDRTVLSDGPGYRTDSLLSSRTHASDVHYQFRTGQSLDRQFTQSPSSQYQSRLSPVLSNEELSNIPSPVGMLSNGSLRTIGSVGRTSEVSPLSPLAPSLACASGVSVLSLAASNVHGGTLGTSSLPPHGHRRGIKRRSSRALKTTLATASRERSLNALLVSFVLAFTLTQLPLLVVSTLRAETSVMDWLEIRYRTLVDDLCLYLSIITYTINPFVMFISYKLYRKFLANRCCRC